MAIRHLIGIIILWFYIDCYHCSTIHYYNLWLEAVVCNIDTNSIYYTGISSKWQLQYVLNLSEPQTSAITYGMTCGFHPHKKIEGE